jgi:hypothetical protein
MLPHTPEERSLNIQVSTVGPHRERAHAIVADSIRRVPEMCSWVQIRANGKEAHQSQAEIRIQPPGKSRAMMSRHTVKQDQDVLDRKEQCPKRT